MCERGGYATWMVNANAKYLHFTGALKNILRVTGCRKCFGCFKHMLQVFYLDIAYVALAIHVCCKCLFQIFQLFQTYVAVLIHIY